jgi:fatty acid desaturase
LQAFASGGCKTIVPVPSKESAFGRYLKHPGPAAAVASLLAMVAPATVAIWSLASLGGLMGLAVLLPCIAASVWGLNRSPMIGNQRLEAQLRQAVARSNPQGSLSPDMPLEFVGLGHADNNTFANKYFSAGGDR